MNLNKPTINRTIILDLSKVLMQDSHNSYIKIDMVINYPEVSRYYNNANILFVGKMKDETYGVPIKCFVILKF